MTQEIRFNHFGIPYIVEFANVSFRPHGTFTRSHTTPVLPTLSRMDSYSTSETSVSVPGRSLPSHASSLRSRSSSRSHARRRRSPSPAESLSSWCSIPPYEPPQTPEAPIPGVEKLGRGLYIQFSSSVPTCEAPPSYSPQPERVRDSMRKKSAIARLRRTIANAVQDAGMESPTATEKQDLLDNNDALGPIQHKTSKSLYRGTYGQVMSALKDAGLMTTPCTELGFEGATRLGALFVAGPNDDGGLEMTKLTLWG